MIKPDFYLIGWDNFSSYLNPSNNLFNTLFATWREHRGLGVPSDAEVTDIFRQLFNIIVSSVFGTKLTDQIYLATMLWGGVMSMYALGRYISAHLHQNEKQKELFGTIAAFFYLFNLCTLGVFYFPMIMYNTRFFMLPSSCLILLKMLHSPRLSAGQYLFYIAILLFGMGAFMVPTIFVVIFMMLGLLFIFTDQKKRFIILMICYIALNSFWLFPFANYAKQKSAIVPNAPTFIEMTESMLNKPKSYYTFERQAKTRPSTFEPSFSSQGKNLPFHPLAANYEKDPTRFILWIFPISYLLGIVYIFAFKRNRILMWLSLTTVTFLILSMKEYSPLGLLYGFISDHFPILNMLFRYGDTKFHALIVFPGAIISAVFFVDLISRLLRLSRNMLMKLFIGGLIIVIGVSHLWVYRSYFDGNFVGFIMYNVIPSAYFDMSKIINKDPEPVRVVQLPMDTHVYWKPYTWGYYGSSFLHFMLNKPIFDRTFEPASMENADIHKQLMDILHLTSSVQSKELLDEQAQNLLTLLQSAGIKYIIDDQTISINIDSRDIGYWGNINLVDSRQLLSYMEEKGNIRLLKNYTVSSREYFPLYTQLYPYNKTPSISYPDRHIYLYEVTGPKPRIQSISSVKKIHSSLQSIPATLRRMLNSDFIQSPAYDKESLIFPFANQASVIQIDQNKINIDLPISLRPGNYTISSNNTAGSQTSHLMNIYVQNDSASKKKTLKIFFENPLFPQVKNAIVANEMPTDLIELPIEKDNYSHIAIGDAVLPLRQYSDDKIHYLGSPMIHDDTVIIKLLYPANTYQIGDQLEQFESNSNCLRDEYESVSSETSGVNGIFNLKGQNVSSCLTTKINIQSDDNVRYAELNFDLKGTAEPVLFEKELDSGKPILNDVVTLLPNPLVVDVCVKSSESSLCLNQEQFFRVSKENKHYFTAIKGILTNLDTLSLTATVRSNQRQKYNINISHISLTTYTKGQERSYFIGSSDMYSSSHFQIAKDTPLALTTPIGLSQYTQLLNLTNDGILIGRDMNCEDQGKIQATKEINNGMLSYSVGCRNYMNKYVPFSTSNFYMWKIDYKHMSGAVPAFHVMDKYQTIFSTNLNPSEIPVNNYFSIPLQKPETVFSNHESIKDLIISSPMHTLNGFIQPRFDLQDHKNKELLINHYTPNEGLAEIDNIAVVELPNYWQNSIIKLDDYSDLRFNSPDKLRYQKIFPSLWKVEVQTKGGRFLTVFNEQFDSQWIVLNAPKVEHLHCNGYVNCYQLDLKPGLTHFYYFYYPELSSFAGFLVSSVTIIGILYFIRRLTYIPINKNENN